MIYKNINNIISNTNKNIYMNNILYSIKNNINIMIIIWIMNYDDVNIKFVFEILMVLLYCYVF